MGDQGERVFDTAWPMLIQMIALPLAMQSNRLILSHVSSVDELATYSLASQMFNPIFSVSIAASMALWPVFARARSRGEYRRLAAQAVADVRRARRSSR